MRRIKIGLGALVVSAAAAAIAGPYPETADDLVVHEWGTFLAMNGSDGASLDGMYHEEHALPAFVHARSRDQLRLHSMIVKGETPVIYFYTERAQRVQVDVRFPRGVWTQWYPQAQIAGPEFAPAAAEPTRGGRLVWCAGVRPASAGAPAPPLPETSADALWNFARDVDAAFVTTSDTTREPGRDESERFLFYRGLGEAPLPLRLSAAEGGTLALDAAAGHGVEHLFVVRVEGGRGTYSYRPALGPGEVATGAIPSLDGAQPLDALADRLADDLAARLVESGLYPKEARAMVNTWRTSYFATEGVRVLFVLPRAWTDASIPMTIRPRPRELVRVMVGRLELLTPARERLAEAAVRDLASPDAPTRLRAFEALRSQGRYVEPIVRRVLRTTGDDRVRALCRRLLLADFVTELRAAVHAPADGRRLTDDRAHVRAQLAALLREVGLDAEARAEGAQALAALTSRTAPPLSHSDSRQYLRAGARAMEGMGDDRGAARWYGEFVRFGSQVRRAQDCRGCHAEAGPRDMAFFRDWWAGRKFADYAAKDEGLDRAIAAAEAALTRDRSDDAARLKLAFLHQKRGDAARAEALWAELGAPGRGPTGPVHAARRDPGAHPRPGS